MLRRVQVSTELYSTVDMKGDMAGRTFPKADWETAHPDEVGMDAGRLAEAKACLDSKLADATYRLAIVRHGYLAAEWTQNIESEEKIHIASANKSILSSTLGIAIAEGKIGSADDLATDTYPELMDVAEGGGPKAGRWAFEANRGITLRHLICNVSGYMKPNEEPGQVFNYQTNGMCILSHCIEKAYGLYSVDDPDGSPKIPPLYKEKIADQIGAGWGYTSSSQKMDENARLHIFGWGSAIRTSLRDLARLGWLWCNWGKWEDKQVIPENWLREGTRVAADILANSPEEVWRYGLGFWTNEKGKLWPELPTEGYTSWGAGGHYAIVFPSYDLVVVMNPTPYPGASQPYETHTATWLQQQEVLGFILEACV
jgi:CubicO group peptidase (beta-lactamase class C family)